MPIYNAEQYLCRAIDSIIAQTLSDWELILIDDGSTDSSSAICDNYAQHDQRIHTIHKKNEGVALARQIGVDKAKGEYSIHADADDWMEPTMLEEMYNEAKKEHADIVIADYFINNNYELENKTICIQKPESTNAIQVLKGIFENKLFGALWNKLLKTELYKKYNARFFYGINYCEDVLIWAQILKHKEIKIPMAYGIFHRRIVLPEIEYSEEEIDIILHHELIHHKHHDLLWKAIFMMVHITYWFHPGMKDLIRQLDQWGEAYCDRTASYYIESMKTYFNVIIDIATEEKECNTYCMGLCENSELLVLRMKRMQSYLNQKPLKRITAVSLILIILGISSITVAASTIGFAKGYVYVADQTMDEESVIETEKVIDYKIDRKEKIRSQKREGIEVIKQGAIIPDVNDAGILDLKLKAKERIETKKKYIDKKKGKEIEISVSTGLEEDHVSKKIAIGIIEPNGKERYIEEGRNLWHGFKINKSGDYVIFIENYGEKDVDISGYCSVNPYITKEEDKKFEESNN